MCPRCAIGFHKSHDVTSIEEVYEHIKVKMDELKKKTESKIYNLKLVKSATDMISIYQNEILHEQKLNC